MSFARYPAYKDSGVEWLGEVPEHWTICSFRHCLSHLFNGMTATQVDEGNDTVPVTRIETISSGLIDESRLGYICTSEARDDRLVRVGDILFSNINSLNMIGNCAYYHGGMPIYAGMNLLVFRPTIDNCPRWVYWLVRSEMFRNVVESLAKPAINQASISQSSINSITVSIPPAPEQTRIAAFLDCETAKIDGLVAEQQRLIDLLKEKRQAVISHAVTKGLNPAAPMKPSGIEWLGDVPAHWRVLKGSLIGTLFGSEQIPEELVRDEGDLPFIKVGSMSSESFEIESWDWYVDRSIASQCNPRCDFIVFPKRGAAIFMNKVNLVDRPSLIDPNLMGWAIGDQANPLFIAHALKTRKLDELADVSTVPQINNKHIAPERFPIPPMQEQLEIVKTLGVETEKIDALTAEVQRAIDLLQERRTALISAAVTGQIDVRELGSRGDAETRSDNQSSVFALRASAPPRETSKVAP